MHFVDDDTSILAKKLIYAEENNLLSEHKNNQTRVQVRF
jgi:hypothetical protein